eukprot:1111031-Pleurochrysis_carterae.AAC.4
MAALASAAAEAALGVELMTMCVCLAQPMAEEPNAWLADVISAAPPQTPRASIAMSRDMTMATF